MSFLHTNTIEKSSVQVAVRVRPLNAREVSSDVITDVSNGTIHIKNPSDKKKKNFNFDYTFDYDATQENVFENIGEKVVTAAYSGYNCCIFAYGQSGCFAKGTPIMSIDGSYKAVEDVVVGDVLMGDDSTERNVLKLFKGRQNMYRVKPKLSGHNEYVVNEDHTMLFEVTPHINVRWVNTRYHWIATWFDAITGQVKKQSFTPESDSDEDIEEARLQAEEFAEGLDKDIYIVEMTVKDYMKLSINKKKFYNCYTTGVDFPEQEVFLDPYLLGLWLGDGTTNGNQITSIDVEIIDYLEAAAEEYGCTLSKNKDSYTFAKIPGAGSGKNNNVRDLLRTYNVFGNKHIPDEYLKNSRKVRLQVLAGLIDTDGFYDTTKDTYEIIQKSKVLADDIIYLARSLGLYASINQCEKGCMYKGEMKTGTYYRCYISGDALKDMPVLLPRKMYRGKKCRANHTFPPEITLIGEDDYYGFMLDGNHRFVGAGFNVLRNSGKTHSVMGPQSDPGLIPRICQALYERQSTNNGVSIGDAVISYKLELSYLEIYSEEVKDLLVKQHTPGGLKVRQHPEFGPYVEGLSQVLVEDYATIKKLIDVGSKERAVATTLLNDRSSRSHAILTIYFTQLIDEPSMGKTREVVSKINLVDLAGSERVEVSGVSGINFKEAININKSLSTLGLVISKLAAHSTKAINAANVNNNANSSDVDGLRTNNLNNTSNLNNSTNLNNANNLNNVHLATKSQYTNLDRYTPTNVKNPVKTNKVIGKSNMPSQVSNMAGNMASRLPPQHSPKYSPKSPSSVNSTGSANSSGIGVGISKKSTEMSVTEHVPFRDSVLTWILKDSLGGNSKTFMIATISPSAMNYNESLSTLRYAYNAKQIVNSVKVNEDPSDKLIRVLKGEIEALRMQLMTKGSDGTTTVSELKQLKDELAQREELMREKDKTWEQKLGESKRISHETQELLKKEFAIKQQEYDKKYAEMEAQMKKEKEDLMKEMEFIKSNSTDKTTLDEEFAKKQAEFEKGRIVDTAVSLQEYYEKKMDALRKECSKAIEDARNAADLRSEEVKMLYAVNTGENNAKIEVLKAEHTAKIEEIKSACAIKIEELKTTCVDKIEALKAEHAAKLEDLKSMHNTKLEELKSMHNTKLEELKSVHTTKLEELKTVSADKLEALKAEHASKLEALKAEHTNVNNALKDSHAKTLDLLKTEYDAKMESTKLEHSKAMESTKLEHSKAMESLKTEQADKTEATKLEHLKAIDVLKTEHLKAIDVLKTEHSNKLTELISEHMTNMESIRLEHTTKIESMKAEHVTDIESLKLVNTEKIEALRVEHLKAIDTLKTEHTTKIESMKIEHTKVVDGLKAEYALILDASKTGQVAKLELEYNNKLEDAKQQLAIKLEENNTKLEEAKLNVSKLESTNASYLTKVEELKSLHAVHVEELKSMHAAHIEEVKIEYFKKLEENTTKIENFNVDHIKKLEESNALYVAKVSDLMTSGAARIDEIKILCANKIEENNLLHAKQMDELKASCANKIEENNLLHAKQMDELKTSCANKIEENNLQHAAKMAEITITTSNKVEEFRNSYASKIEELKSVHAAKLEENKAECLAAVSEVKKEHAEKLAICSGSSETRINEEIKSLRSHNAKLLTDLAKAQSSVAQYSKQLISDRTMYSKQIQQLQSKILSLESVN